LRYSIIIPTLNEEKLLPRLLKQISENHITDDFDAELIISDGGSIDRTIEIARKFTDKIIVHTEKRRQNISEGRNSGVKLSTGEVLIFLGADIEIPDIKGFFQNINSHFIMSRYLGMTCSVKISPDEELPEDRYFHWFLNNYFYLLNLIGLGMGRGECQIVWRNVFDQFHGYNDTLAAGEDFDLFKRIRQKGEILYARNLCVYESPRRYRKYGYMNVMKSWFVNSFYVLFKNKSRAQEWEQIR